MHKSIALVLIVAAALATAQVREDAVRKRLSAVGPKDFDMKRLEGRWFELASSKELHQTFLKGCKCNVLEFAPLSANKLHVVTACQNATTGKIAQINGTLTQIRPEENKSLFNLVFTEKKAAEIPGVELNKTEAREVKTMKEGGEGKELKKGEDTAAKAKVEANAVVLKVGPNFEHIVMGSPVIDAIWILSRKQQLNESVLQESKKFLEQSGFTAKNLVKIDHSNCSSDLIKKAK